MEKFKMDLERRNKCPKCGSENVINRFDKVEDTDDYHFHYDTLKCVDCDFWDFPSAFDHMDYKSNNTEICPKCKAQGEVKLYYFDWLSGELDLKCTACNHTDSIIKFVGMDRWEEFMQEERASSTKFLEEYDDDDDDDDYDY